MLFRRLDALNAEDRASLAALYRGAGWLGAAEDDAFLVPMVAGSFLAIGAYTAEGRLVGFGRALSDGCSDAYLQDVVVAEAFRRRGIGAEIVGRLTAELRRRGIDWIGLVGEPGTELFYRRLNWQKQDDFTLWRAPER